MRRLLGPWGRLLPSVDRAEWTKKVLLHQEIPDICGWGVVVPAYFNEWEGVVPKDHAVLYLLEYRRWPLSRSFDKIQPLHVQYYSCCRKADEKSLQSVAIAACNDRSLFIHYYSEPRTYVPIGKWWWLLPDPPCSHRIVRFSQECATVAVLTWHNKQHYCHYYCWVLDACSVYYRCVQCCCVQFSKGYTTVAATVLHFNFGIHCLSVFYCMDDLLLFLHIGYVRYDI